MVKALLISRSEKVIGQFVGTRTRRSTRNSGRLCTHGNGREEPRRVMKVNLSERERTIWPKQPQTELYNDCNFKIRSEKYFGERLKVQATLTVKDRILSQNIKVSPFAPNLNRSTPMVGPQWRETIRRKGLAVPQTQWPPFLAVRHAQKDGHQPGRRCLSPLDHHPWLCTLIAQLITRLITISL